MIPRKFAVTLSVFTIILIVNGYSYSRCGPSYGYQAEIQIFSCQDVDPNDESRLIGYGVILDVNVLSKKRIESPEGYGHVYDWWPTDDALPKQMKIFYDTKDKAPCTSLKPGTKRKGTLRALCCDGGEPRCNLGVAVSVYGLKK
jgi:hypothetical protein